MEKLYAVSLDIAGSGADFLTESISERNAKYHEYWDYLQQNKLAGTVTVREDIIPYERWKEAKTDPTYYFDTVDWDKTKVLYRKEYHPRMMKSKADLERQIQRIHAIHKDHRLYNRAQNLVLKYNHLMSITAENEHYWREWRRLDINPEEKQQADALLRKMHETPYHRNLYSGAATR